MGDRQPRHDRAVPRRLRRPLSRDLAPAARFSDVGAALAGSTSAQVAETALPGSRNRRNCDLNGWGIAERVL
ncbi:hypothetical protein MICRO8M_10077 [Microbacterium sp. 8M]|nr:hypothetical protein MICRO8M_10077 [Microbacterium sp. 8M]